MASIVGALRRVPQDAVERALPQFLVRTYDAGAQVTREGELADSLLFLAEGELEIDAGGVPTTRLGPGTFLGEIGLFVDGIRTATARALGDVRLLELPHAGYDALVAARNPVADEIERIAGRALARWLRDVGGEIVASMRQASPAQLAAATLAQGPLVPGRPTMATVGQITQRIARAGDGANPFAGADPGSLAVIAAQLRVGSFAAGERIAAAERDAPGLSIVLAGEVDVCAPIDAGGRGVRITTLAPGAFVGASATIEQAPMWCFAQAVSAVTIAHLAPSVFDRLYHGGDKVGRLLRIACIRDLSAALVNANATLTLHHATARGAPARWFP